MELLSFTLSIFIVFLHLSILCRAQNDSYFYDACAPYACGNVTVTFPFSSSESFCSLPGFQISCDRSSSIPTITISGRSYQVRSIFLPESLIKVSDAELAQNLTQNRCVSGLQDHFLPAASFAPFELPTWGVNLNFSLCNSSGDDLPSSFTSAAINLSDQTCGATNESVYVLPVSGPYDGEGVLPSACHHAALPVQLANLLRGDKISSNLTLFAVADGFPLQWTANITRCSACTNAGGRCGYNQSTSEVVCFCSNGCEFGGGSSSRSSSWKIIVASVVPAAFIAAIAILLFIKYKNRLSFFNKSSSRGGSKSVTRSGDPIVEDFIRSYRSMLPVEYSYSDLKKITDGLKNKLGEGGHGNVYKGRLANGQYVAVKILEKCKDNAKDFMNEVATIGRIYHLNIIKLLGFCIDGSHRAIVYEFMPKGSLGDLMESSSVLDIGRLLDIAIGIARGIEYLHYGCDKIILHLDIKPQNVLLDDHLQPKISDFGLATLYSRKDSSYSLAGARGTFGYIAPELFMRNLGGVSGKSDVYSFGMVLLEMVIGKKNHLWHSSKDFSPDWIYEQLKQWSRMEIELDDDAVVEEGVGLLRKMVMVGLWCIQTNPAHRPSISRALEMLRGVTESIPLPPRPHLFSPPKQMDLELSNYNSGSQ